MRENPVVEVVIDDLRTRLWEHARDVARLLAAPSTPDLRESPIPRARAVEGGRRSATMLDLQQTPLALAGRPQPRPPQVAQVAAQQTPRRASPVAHRPPPVRSMSASAVTLASGG